MRQLLLLVLKLVLPSQSSLKANQRHIKNCVIIAKNIIKKGQPKASKPDSELAVCYFEGNPLWRKAQCYRLKRTTRRQGTKRNAQVSVASDF